MGNEVLITIRVGTDTKDLDELPAHVQQVIKRLLDGGLDKAFDQAAAAADRLGNRVDQVGGSAGRTASRFDELRARGAQALQDLKDRTEAAFGAINQYGSAIAGAGARLSAGLSAPIGIAAALGIRFDDLKQRAEIAFTTMLGSADAARDHLDQLLTFARTTPFEAEGLIMSSQKLQAMGLDARNIIPTLAALGDNVAAVGGGAPLIDRLTLALGQMVAKGKLVGGELRQFAEAGVPMLQMLAQHYGKTVAQVQEMSEKGLIDAGTALKAFVDGTSERFGGLGNMMQKQSQTFSGVLSTIKDTVTQTLGSVMQPAFDALSDTMLKVAPILLLLQERWEALDPSIQKAVLAFFLILAAVGPVAVAIGGLMMLMTPLTLAIGGLGVVMALFAAAWIADWGFLRDMTAGVVQGVASVLGGVFGFISDHAGLVTALLGVLAVAIVGQVVPALISMGVHLAMSAGAQVLALGQWLAAGIMNVVSFGVTLVQAAAQVVIFGASLLVQGVGAVAGFAVSLLTTVVPSLATFIGSAVFAGVTFLTTTVPALLAGAPAALAAAAGFLVGLVPALATAAASAIAAGASFLVGLIPAIASVVLSVAGMAVAFLTVAVPAFFAMLAAAAAAAVGILIANAPLIIGLGVLIGVIWLLWQNWDAVWNAICTATKAVASWLGSVISSLWSFLSSIFGQGLSFIWGLVKKAWGLIGDVFQKAAGWVADKVGALFEAIRDLFQRGLQAAIDIAKDWGTRLFGGIKKIFGKILDTIVSAVSKIPELIGRGLAALDSVLGTSFGSMATGVAAGLRGIIDKFSGGADTIGDVFGSLGKEGGGSFLSGIKEKLLGKGGLAGLLGGEGEGGLLGGLMSTLGLKLPETPSTGVAGMTGKAAKGPYNPGDTGVDSKGEFYYDQDGKKVYTSGVGLAAQSAKMDKEGARRAAPAADRESSVAQTMANVAERVSDAVMKGLEALRILSDADLPDRAKWLPKLDAVQEFIAAALAKFDELGAGLLAKIGVLEDGVQILDTSKAEAMDAVAQLSSGMLDAMTKAGQFLAGIVNVRFPEQGQIDRAFDLIGDLLTRVRDKGRDLASVFQDGGEDGAGDGDGENPASTFTTVGQGMATWVDLWGKLTEGAVRMGTSARELAQAPAAMGIVERLMMQIAEAGGRLVEAARRALPEEQRAELLGLSQDVAETEGAWIGVVDQLGQAAVNLRSVVRIPEDIGVYVERFFTEIARIGWTLVSGLQDGFPSRHTQLETLEVSRAVADTLTSLLQPVAALGQAAKSLRDVVRIPEGTAALVGRFLTETASTVWNLVSELQRGMPNIADQLEALQVSQLTADVLASAVEMVGRTAEAIVGLKDLPELPDAALDRVESVLRGAAGMLHRLMRGPDYDLFRDIPAAQEGLGLVQSLVATLTDGVGLLLGVAEAGKSLAEAVLVSDDQLGVVTSNVARMWEKLKELTATFREQLPEDQTELIDGLKRWVDGAKAALDIMTAGAGIAVDWAQVTAIPAHALSVAAVNVRGILDKVESEADLFLRREAGGIQKVMDEKLAVMRAWVDGTKAAVDLMATAGGLTVDWSQATAIPAHALSIAAVNIRAILARVEAEAALWARGFADNAAMTERQAQIKAWVDSAAATVKMVADAGVSLGKLAEIDVSAGVSKIDVVIAQVRLIFEGLSTVMATISVESAEARGKLATAAGSAAEGLGKAGDFIAKFVDNPFFVSRQGSSFFQRVRTARADWLAERLKETIRRVVNALVDGLTGITVPEGLGDGLDRLVGVYERLAGLLERIQALAVPDPAKIREIAAAAVLLIASLGMQSPSALGGATGGLRLPVGVTAPTGPPMSFAASPGAAFPIGNRPPTGSPGPPPINITVPPSPPPAVNVYLDSEQIAARIMQNGHDRWRRINGSQTGGG